MYYRSNQLRQYIACKFEPSSLAYRVARPCAQDKNFTKLTGITKLRTKFHSFSQKRKKKVS